MQIVRFAWITVAMGFAAGPLASRAFAHLSCASAQDAQGGGGCEIVQTLMRRIDGDLDEINKLLNAAASERAAASGKDAAKAALAKQKDAAEAIQKILEHVHDAQQSSGGS